MNVLLVTHGAKDWNTAVYRNTSLRAEFLRQLGHDVRVIAPVDIGVTRGRLMPLVYPFAVAWWILRRAAVDTIAFQSHTGWVYQLVRSMHKKHHRTRVAVTFHGLDALYVKALAEDLVRQGRRQTFRFRLLHEHILPRLSRWSCRRADRVFCMNATEERFLIRNRWTTSERLRRMPNYIEPDASSAPPPGHSGSHVRLLSVAQWFPQKGTRYLVEAFARLARSAQAIELTCVGTQRPAAEVLSDFPEDVRDRVVVVPSVAHEAISQMYARSDVFVLSSIFEGFSIALLEAMAAGLPIVATSVGAAPEILTTGRDALLVPPADASALESALRSLVADPERRRLYGDRARVRAAAFTCDRVLSQFAADLLGAQAAEVSTA